MDPVGALVIITDEELLSVEKLVEKPLNLCGVDKVEPYEELVTRKMRPKTILYADLDPEAIENDVKWKPTYLYLGNLLPYIL